MDLIILQPGNKEIAGTTMINGDVVGGDSLNIRPGSIELVSCHFSMKQQMTTDVSNSARTSGRPDLQDITCVKYVDQSSPKLYNCCLGATPIGIGKDLSYIYILRNSDAEIGNILTLELQDAMVSSIAMQSHPNDMATEQFTLNFTAIKWTATVQDNAAATKGHVVAAWDVSTDRPLKNLP